MREIFTGTYASDMGPWTPDAGKAMRYRDRLGRADLALLYNVSAEFAYSLDRRPPRRPGAQRGVLVASPTPSSSPARSPARRRRWSDLEAVKKALPDTPVLANTGVKHATVADVLQVADGCIVGSSLKVDGNTWNAVDPERAAEFMRLARAARGMSDAMKDAARASASDADRPDADPRALAATRAGCARYLATRLPSSASTSRTDRLGNLIATLEGDGGRAERHAVRAHGPARLRRPQDRGQRA